MDFEGIAAPYGWQGFDTAGGLNVLGANFVGGQPARPTYPRYLRVVDDAFYQPFYDWNSGAVLHGAPTVAMFGEGGLGSYVLATFPAGITAAGSDIMTFAPYASQFEVIITTADLRSFTFSVPSSNYPDRAFVGFIADQPILSVRFAAAGFPVLDNVAFGRHITDRRCTPPLFVGKDVENAFPLVNAIISNQRVQSCTHVADVRITNTLSGLWLGLEHVITRSDLNSFGRPTVTPLASSQRLEDWARHGLVPPCRFSGVFDPVCDAGASSWRVGFPASGEVQFRLALTGRAALMTIVDNAFALTPLGMTASELIGLADDLERVPTIASAKRCLEDSNRDGRVDGVACAAAELLRITTRFRQQDQIVGILARYAINRDASEVVQHLLGFPVEALEVGISLSIYGLATGSVPENPGRLTVKIQAR